MTKKYIIAIVVALQALITVAAQHTYMVIDLSAGA